MKTTVLLSLMFLIVSMFLCVAHTTAQYEPRTQWGLPEDAKARLGKGNIIGVTYSTDNSRLAVASSIGIWIYDAQTGKELSFLNGLTAAVSDIAFSPDGTILATTSNTDVDMVHLWDVATGMLNNTLKGHASVITSIAFSPDGATLAGGGDIILTALVSEDDALLEALFTDLEDEDLVDAVWLWDIATGTIKNTFEGSISAITSVVFSPDSTTLASQYENGDVLLWDVATGIVKNTFERHTDVVRSIAFSPDGTTLAGALGDSGVGLWDVATGILKNTLKGDTDLVRRLVFSSDGATLASASWDDTVHLWEVATGTLKNTLKGDIVFSPDGATFVGVSEHDTLQVKLRRLFEGHTDIVKSVVFSPDGTTLASGYGNGDVLLWDVATGTAKTFVSPFGNTLEAHTDEVNVVGFSPNGTTLASASASSSGIDTTVRLWDVATGKPKATLEGHTSTVWSVVFSPDGQTLASASWDETVRLWDVATGTKNTLEGHTDAVNSVAFSPDGTTLASVSWDDTVRLWDVASGTHKATLEGHMSNISHVVFSPDGTTLASGSSSMGDDALFLSEGDTVVHLWDVASGTLEATRKGHTNVVSSVDFSPDGTTLASGSWDGTVLLWDVAPSTPDVVAVEPLAKRFTTLGDIKRTALLQNYPNPFNPETWIPYQLAEDAMVTLTIYNSSGLVVRTLELGNQSSGSYESRDKAAYWDGCNEDGEVVTSGVYFYQFRSGDFSALRRMVILK